MSDKDEAKTAGGRAFLKEGVLARAEEGPALAPRGDYNLECRESGVGLCSCATQNRFTLSFDAFLQHLNEGRIAIVDR
jgi:hypothetical protein